MAQYSWVIFWVRLNPDHGYGSKTATQVLAVNCTHRIRVMTMKSDDQQFRIEHDTMGEVRVPVDALYSAQTQRAVENFPISGQGLEPAHIHALGLVKKACAVANHELGVITDEQAEAITAAADQIIGGQHDEQFPIDVFQTGSGTSSNMNTNEVIANLANRALQAAGADTTVHPNDHVNASQSSNEVFPTSVHVAVTSMLINELKPALAYLAESLERKAQEFADVVKAGRSEEHTSALQSRGE